MDITVSPSLLSADFLNLQSELDAFKACSNLWFHIDIMDGHYVPNLTIGTPIVSKLAKATSHKLDAHFMVTNPEFYVDVCKDYGLHNFTFHWEATHHHDRLISELKKFYPSVGISLNPATTTELIPDYILKKIDLVLVMTVNPGFGGQSFISAGLDKVEALAKKRAQLKANFVIQVDGGVGQENAKTLIQKGASNLVAGSYIFKVSPDQYASQVNSLRS